MDAATELEVIHLLLDEGDKMELESILVAHGVECIAETPPALAASLRERFGKRAVFRDLQALIDSRLITG